MTGPLLAGLLGMIALLAGCATPARVAPLTVDEIVLLSRGDTPPEQIVEHIRESRATYRLPASELAKLREQGVADPVIDTMQTTYLEHERRQGMREGRDLYWWWHYDSRGFNSVFHSRRHLRHRR